MNNDPSSNRKTTTPIKVCCTPDERQTLIKNAEHCGLSVSNFLRTVGLGVGVVSVVDHRKVDELVKVNGELGRLGGLLKLCLTNDACFQPIDTHGFKDEIKATITDIKANQASLKAIIKLVVKP